MKISNKIKIILTTLIILLTFGSSTTGLNFFGFVYSLATVIGQKDLGYMQIGETHTFTILQTNETINPNDLNLSTTCQNGQAISGALNWKDESGIGRNQPLNLNGNTTFTQKITDRLNLTVVAVSASQFNCTLNFINSTVTFLNFTSDLP